MAATYGIVQMTTYKGTQDDVLALCGDSETNVYYLNDIIDVTGQYLFTVWYKSASEAGITFNVFGEEETVTSNTEWKKYIKRINVKSVDNNDITITVTPDINTYFYEAFCVNGRADTSWYPSDLDIDENILDASKKATNYITSFDESGLWITPENAKPNSTTGEVVSGVTSGWHISGSIELFLKGIRHFWVGIQDGVAKIILGLESAGHLLLEPTKINLKTNANTVVAQFQAPTVKADILSSYCTGDGSVQMTSGAVVCSVSIPQNCTVTSIDASFTDELFNIYTISDDAVYDSNDPDTWFIYDQTSDSVTVKANGTFIYTYQTDITLDVHVNTTVSSNYIGSYPYRPNDNLFTIGNGLDANNPSNALEMDWQGNIDLPNGFIQGKQNILWSGGHYMVADHIARLSEPVSAQSNGVVLIWSAYSSGEPKNYHWKTYFVPRAFVQPPYAGMGHCISFATVAFDFVGSKYVYINDNTIKGHADNNKTGTANGITYNNAHWVLRYVIGV